MKHRWNSQASRDSLAYFITWTTYGTWLPGDARGWRRRDQGYWEAEPMLETWCRNRMRSESVLLRPNDRETVAAACNEHVTLRGWHVSAIYAGTNHVHVVLTAPIEAIKVRDQLKANCTRALRRQHDPLVREKTWTKGGDCVILWTEKEVEAAVAYVVEGQTGRRQCE